jgi:hypothetical protein
MSALHRTHVLDHPLDANGAGERNSQAPKAVSGRPPL